MRILFFDRSTMSFKDGFNIIEKEGSTISYDYLETSQSEIYIETNLGFSNVKTSDWGVVISDNKVIYAGYVTDYDSDDITKVFLTDWRGALISNLFIANTFSDNISASSITDWESLLVSFVNGDYGSRKEAQIEFLVAKKGLTITPMSIYNGKSVDKYDPSKKASVNVNDQNEDPFETYVGVTRLDIIDTIYKRSNALLRPDKIIKQPDGTYRLSLVAENIFGMSDNTSRFNYSDNILPISVNSKDESISDFVLNNHRFDIMEPNALMLVVANWNGTSWAGYSTYWYFRTYDGRITTNNTDPQIILPSKTKIEMVKSTDGFDNVATRNSYANNNLAAFVGDFDISFAMDMDNNFLINSFEVKGDGTANNQFVVNKKTSIFDNVWIGGRWIVYDNGIQYNTALTGYEIDFENGVFKPKLGYARSTMKFIISQLIDIKK